MAEAPANLSTGLKAWSLWSMRLVALFNVLLLAGPFVYLAAKGSLEWGFAVVMILPLALPQLVLLLRLIRPGDKGLRHAAGTGAAGMAIAGLLLVLILSVTLSDMKGWLEADFWVILGIGILVGLVEWVLFRNARKAQEAQGPALGIWKKWLESATTNFICYFVVIFLWAATLPGLMHSGRAPNEASSVGALRTILTAALSYRDQYQNGFPPNLAALGPPPAGSMPSCAAADLIDPILASGKKSGYSLEYRPGPPVAKPAPGCPPGVTGYSITARPVEYGKTGRRSFLTDESGVIRWTAEDRPATASDPPIN